MPGFMDIVAAPSIVKIDGQDCAVPGVSLDGVAALCQRFPWLSDLLLAGKAISMKDVKVDELLKSMPDAAAAIGAASLGYPGNADAEARFRLLTVGVQLEILAKSKKRTMPDGVAPFVESLIQLGILVPGEPSVSSDAGQASTLPNPSNDAPANTDGQSTASPS